MTVEAYSSLPFQAGSAVAAAAGRAAHWVISMYMRQPLRNTALCALIGLSAMAGSNALYKQAHHHPAPLFGSFSQAPMATKPAAKPKPAPVMPATRPATLSDDTTGSIDSAAPAAATISNADVQALQQKLAALNLFTGTADGLFGPRTAKAIKAFETKIGRTPRGLLTPQILDLIRQAPISSTVASDVAAQVAEPAATPAPAPEKVIAPLALVTPAKPLPAPAPLVSVPSTTGAAAAETPPDGNAKPGDMQTASIDHSAGTESLPMTAPPTVAKRAVATITVHAQPAQSMPAELPAATTDDASTDPDTVAAIQRGLNSLGFLHIPVDGVAGEATSKAIRNFEVYYNYDVTGRITKGLVNLLVQNGAVL